MDQTLKPSCLRMKSGNAVLTKNIFWSFPKCDSSNLVTDHTLSISNEYEYKTMEPHIFNLPGFQATDATNCPIHTVDVHFVDFANLSSVPGLTETAHEFCKNRASSANCDGSSDFYLKWAFTKSYSALKIKLRGTFVNGETYDS